MIRLSDEYTIALGITAAATYLISSFLVPPPLVHPLLLGRQSHVAQVRKENESAVHSNYGIGASPLPIAPSKGVTTQVSLLRQDAPFDTAERWLWDHKVNNRDLQAKVARIGAALCAAAGLVPKGSRVLLLLRDSLEWLISDLALASYCVPSITLSSNALLTVAMESHSPTAIIVDASELVHLLELLQESSHTPVIVVVGDRTGETKVWAKKVGLKLITWEELESVPASSLQVPIPIPADVSSAHFFAIKNGALKGAQFTHQNVVAGATGVLNVLPTIGPWGEKDTVVSAHSLSTPYGRSIMYAALYSGANFSTMSTSRALHESQDMTPSLSEVIRASEHESRPSPTILFVTPKHLNTMTTSILSMSKKSPFFWFVWRHKYSALLRGYLVKDGFWDRHLFTQARLDALGSLFTTLRGVVVGPDALDYPAVLPARIALSVPLVSVYANPLATGPIFASHPLDVQVLETEGTRTDDTASKAHSGPPTCNVSVKVINTQEEAVAGGADPEGNLQIKGPGVGDPIPMGVQSEEGWVDSGVTARIRSNGTFIVGNPAESAVSSTHDFTLI